MLSPIETMLFILLVFICAVAAYYTWGQMFRIIYKGQNQLSFDNFGQRILSAIRAFLSQGDIISHRRTVSMFHYAVAYGFVFYGLVTLVDVAEGLIPGFHFLEDNIIGDIFRLFADVFGVLVLISLLFFLVRRFGRKDPVLRARENVKLNPKARDNGINVDSLVVIVFISLHMLGSLFMSASRIALSSEIYVWQPAANLVATTVMSNWPEGLLTFTLHFSFWISIGLIVLFIPYFPYTKHIHLIMGPLNIMTAPERTYEGQLKTLDFEDESIEQFGAATLFDLDKTQVFDTFACIMCNRCQEACPAYNTGKELSPAALEINKRYYVKGDMAGLANGNSADARLLDFAISESAVWACTTCAACIDVCPVGNTPMLDIIDIRRDQVLMESSFPDELKGAFVGLERAGNPWQSTESRLEWTKPLPFEVPTVEENPDFEVLLWVGCAGAFNPDSQYTVRAVATILHEAQVSFAILGEAETCTGDAARRAGNEYLFWEMAQGNIETLNAAGADKKKIVTSCPHCFTTIGKEYGELGGHYHVMHHTQLIADLVGRGKLRLNGSKLEKVTFHDPCYLGRQSGVIQEPRDALAKAGATLLEMDKHGRDSFCCGAGGAQYWKEEEHGSQAVNITRYEQARATGAKTLAVGCPFCATMMIDANREHGEAMRVKDVAELVVEAM
ncbi:MAG: heterodisulfide reductase-related iron-sulfur binding cluster [Candidatus Promineifilaceae bacterium]|nr:heterodisulfide reductase-related iron-sulfur binding cluster [Candidatus Promineifilaceae bacterium]